MNAVRKRVLDLKTPYKDYVECKDLVVFGVGADYFAYDYDYDEYLDSDFYEVIAVVEKEWLFESMLKDGIENPLDYLQNVYTWDDSYEWFLEACEKNKVVMIEFN